VEDGFDAKTEQLLINRKNNIGNWDVLYRVLFPNDENVPDYGTIYIINGNYREELIRACHRIRASSGESRCNSELPTLQGVRDAHY